MIEIKNISKSFGEQRVLNDVSAVFEAGQTNLVIGISGSGKTVLMKIMIGLIGPDKGNVFFNGRDFYALSRNEQKDLRREIDRKSTRLNSSHSTLSRMPSSA